jgi:hypothetical protein
MLEFAMMSHPRGEVAEAEEALRSLLRFIGRQVLMTLLFR